MRGSSVHFKRIASAIHAVSHASRDVAPEYLLPADVSMGTHVVIDDQGQVQKLLEHKLSLASRQAKATKDYSPMWEGVINLPDPADATPQQQIEIVKEWCVAYEKMTGHKVIRADVHLDEGFVDDSGKACFNAHAHVMCDRTDDKGKVKKLTSTVLREVQNMTAEVTTLQRGIDSRKTGRKHIGHQHFRFDAEKNRLDVEKPKADLARLQNLSKEWSDSDLQKIKNLQAKIDSEPSRLVTALSAQKLQLDEQYRLEREALETKYKADREAYKTSTEKKTQQDYKDLKTAHLTELDALAKAHASDLADLQTKLAEAQSKADLVPDLQAGATKAQAEIDRLAPLAGKVPQLVAQIALLTPLAAQVPELAATVTSQADQIAQLKAQYQQDYKDLKKAHEAELAKAQTQASKVPQLEAQIAQIAPLEAKVQGLEMTLKSTQKKVEEMDKYTKDISEKLAEADKKIAIALIAKAEAIEALVRSGEKSEALLETANANRAEAEKLTAKVADLTQTAAQRLEQIVQLGKAVAGVNEKWEQADYQLTDALNEAGLQATNASQLAEKLAASQEKLGKLEVKHETFKAKAQTKMDEIIGAANEKIGKLDEELVDVKAKFAAMANNYQTAKSAGTPAHLIIPNPKPTKTAQEPPKEVQAPTPLPMQEKSISEAIKASWEAMLAWIKGKGGVLVDLDTQQSDHYGPVVQLDDLHAVQSTGKGKHVVHELARLDRVPALDDSKTEISYRAGVGQVKGRGVGKGGIGD